MSAVKFKDELDVRDDVCPYTLVKSRMAIEALAKGEVLRVHLGNSESAANVPRSLDLEGHEVLDISQPDAGHWIIDIQRG